MKTLQPSLKLLPVGLARAADKAGTTPRTRGRAWMAKRQAVLTRDGWACAACGRVSLGNQVDHAVPLEQGGSDDMSNLRALCVDCHKAKTARETGQRYGNRGGVQKFNSPTAGNHLVPHAGKLNRVGINQMDGQGLSQDR